MHIIIAQILQGLLLANALVTPTITAVTSIAPVAPAEPNADADGTALYKDRPFQTAAGDVTSSISEGSIS